MQNYLDLMKPYWEKRFLSEGSIWSEMPSNTATHACKLFSVNGIKKILIPGVGYGRNSKVFSGAGYDVAGIEISDIALDLAKIYDPPTTLYNGSVLEVQFRENSFDAIYCFNVLHLFREKERVLFINKCYRELKENGFIYFVVFSEEESSFGQGEEVENNTFESKPGRPVHYFTEDDLIQQFGDFKLISTGLIDDREEHGEEGAHTHKLRYIFCEKVKS